MKTAVVFYSLEGNTRFAAEKIAERLGAEIIELKPVKAFPTGKASKYFWGGKSATFKEKPELEPYSFAAKELDALILGTPLWAWAITPPLRTFLSENDLSGSRVAAFISCGGGDTGKAFETIREMTHHEQLLGELTLVNPLQNEEEAGRNIEEFCRKLSL